MKKLLASMLCMAFICGMGAGLVGCTKEEPAKKTPEVKKEVEAAKKEADAAKKEADVKK
jgi:hypothetical protein